MGLGGRVRRQKLDTLTTGHYLQKKAMEPANGWNPDCSDLRQIKVASGTFSLAKA